MSGRKIPSHLENPFDNVFYFIIEHISDWILSVGLTPNMITAIACLFKLGSLRSLYDKNFPKFATFWYVAYFLDCVDGYIARKYEMVSSFGDHFDHMTDLIQYVIALVIIFFKYDFSLNVRLLLMIFAILCFTFLGCQQSLYKTEQPKRIGETLDLYESLCVKQDMIQWTRFFGSGTFMLVFVLSVYHHI